MRILRLLACALAACCLLPVTSAAEVSVSGVKYEEATDLRGNRLHLNGAGTRYRGPFKVYTLGLYLGRKAATPEEALAIPGAKRISVTMLREIDAGELGKLFIRSVEDNMDRVPLSKLIPGLLRMSQIFSDHKKLQPGDNFTIDWVPGSGTVISVRGVPQGEPFKEPEFYAALLRIWLGPAPADWKLKESLLGKPA
jgi:Chalcone isomerase-like